MTTNSESSDAMSGGTPVNDGPRKGKHALVAFCGNGHVLEVPSFGDMWFTKAAYPVCPECGGDSSDFELKHCIDVTPWWKPTKWESADAE